MSAENERDAVMREQRAMEKVLADAFGEAGITFRPEPLRSLALAVRAGLTCEGVSLRAAHHPGAGEG